MNKLKENKESWNLTDLFKSKEEFHKAVKQMQEDLKKIENYKGKLCDSADNLYTCYNIYESI